MKGVHLMLQCAVWAAAAVAINGAVNHLAQSTLPRQIARAIDASPPVSDLFVGNSLMMSGLDTAEYEARRPERRGLNIALGSTSPVEHDILLRRALGLRPERVFYGFFDTQLTDPVVAGGDVLTGNRALAYYLDLDSATRFYASGDPVGAWRMRLTAWVPVLVERSTLWARVEMLRRRLGDVGLPPQPSSRFGRAQDFALLEASDEAGFAERCEDAARRELAPPVRDMLDVARRAGCRVVVVEMPLPSEHRRRFYDTAAWTFYRAQLIEQVRRAGGAYLIASDWMAEDAFADPLHLNTQGASQFSRRLAMVELPAF